MAQILDIETQCLKIKRICAETLIRKILKASPFALYDLPHSVIGSIFDRGSIRV